MFTPSQIKISIEISILYTGYKMTIVSTTKQINRSPEQVRRVVRRYLYNYPANDQLLDFAKMPEWTQGFIRSIEPAVKKNTIEEGDKLNVTLEGASFSPVVLVRSHEKQNRAHSVRKTRRASLNGGAASRSCSTATTASALTTALRLGRPRLRTRRSLAGR